MLMIGVHATVLLSSSFLFAEFGWLVFFGLLSAISASFGHLAFFHLPLSLRKTIISTNKIRADRYFAVLHEHIFESALELSTTKKVSIE